MPVLARGPRESGGRFLDVCGALGCAPRLTLSPALALVLLSSVGALLVARRVGRLWRHGVAVRRARRAGAGERRARRLLVARGYRVLEEQAFRRWTIRVDGEPLDVELRADFVVMRGDRRFVADAKTGAVATVRDRATRRQLLEYRVAFDVDGVLLVDADRGVVRELVFPLAPRPVRRLAVVLGFALGVAAGLLFGLWNPAG